MTPCFSLRIDFLDKAVQVKFADASKNKKLYKSGFDVGEKGRFLERYYRFNLLRK